MNPPIHTGIVPNYGRATRPSHTKVAANRVITSGKIGL